MTGALEAVQQVLSTDELRRAPAARPTGSTSTRRSSSTRSAWRPRRATPQAFGMPDLQRYITFGASPRASINLILTARALAFIRGRAYALPQDIVDMARDVMRHRLVLSFEALSDDVTSRRHADHRPRSASRPRPSRRRSSPTSTSTPERILQRLDWQVIRRLDGLLQGDYRSLFHGNGVGPGRPARVPAR